MRAKALHMLPVAASIALLAGCATRSGPQVAAPPPPAQALARPLPPRGSPENMILPALAADGRRITPNRGLSPMETLWHVRMALNVAALSCRDPADTHRIAYNRLLTAHKAALTKTNGAVADEYRQRFGGQALGARDAHDTMVYNFFALPPAQPGFCATAAQVATGIAAMPSAQLAASAPAALAALERPFLDFYASYADYQQRLARWNAGDRFVAAPAPQTITPGAPRTSVATVAAAEPATPRLAFNLPSTE